MREYHLLLLDQNIIISTGTCQTVTVPIHTVCILTPQVYLLTIFGTYSSHVYLAHNITKHVRTCSCYKRMCFLMGVSMTTSQLHDNFFIVAISNRY